MAHIPHRIPRGFFLAMVGVLCATLLAPVAALADTDLVIGGQARIAYANGDDVRLRDEPAYESNVLALIPESTILEVLDGPFEATDASFWYYVAYNGQQGYMDATYLQVYGGEEAPPPVEDVPVVDVPVTTEAPAPQEAQVVAGAVGAVTGFGVIAGTNGDGVRCRADAGSGSATITVLPEGTEVELTGAAIDVWQPVNCAGSGGFVHNAYVSYGGAPPAGDDGVNPEPDAEQPAAEEPAPAEDDSTFEASATVTGSATVAGTNGDGLRCRDGAGTDSSTITVMSEGTVVNLRGGAEGDWQPVLCAGRNGWAHVSYLSYSGVPGDGGGEDGGGDGDEATAQASGVARVTGTGGGGLNCRSSAQMGNNVITVLSEGASVELRGAPQGSWQPVICAGRNGFASVDYLSSTGGGGGDDGGGDDGGSGGGSTVTGQGQVTNASGGLNCRSSAQMGNNVITILPDGSRVDLRGGAQGDWQPVVCAGRNGFVHVDYISVGSSGGGGDDDGGSSGGGGGSNSGFSEGMAVEVAGTNGDGLRLRSGASSGSSTITVMSEGTVVSVIGGSSGDWVAVSFDGIEGFAHMDYLTASDGTPSGGGSSGGGDDGGSSGGGGGWRLSAGDHAATTDALNLRYEPSSSSGVAAVAPAGTVVEITGGPSNGYYPVNWDGLSGFMYNSYLSWTDAGLSERGGSGNNGGNDGGGGGGDNGGGASGSSMVDFAMQYLGYPYVWATAGPGSFDCSGFTYWVTLNVLGQDIGRGLWTQVAAGTPVSRSNLQPGDLVFFQNTYTWGLSHVGIYIGGGQFIHAENENTGVKISDLGSNYYSSRWYGAVRLT